MANMGHYITTHIFIYIVTKIDCFYVITINVTLILYNDNKKKLCQLK